MTYKTICHARTTGKKTIVIYLNDHFTVTCLNFSRIRGERKYNIQGRFLTLSIHCLINCKCYLFVNLLYLYILFHSVLVFNGCFWKKKPMYLNWTNFIVWNINKRIRGEFEQLTSIGIFTDKAKNNRYSLNISDRFACIYWSWILQILALRNPGLLQKF